MICKLLGSINRCCSLPAITKYTDDLLEETLIEAKEGALRRYIEHHAKESVA